MGIVGKVARYSLNRGKILPAPVFEHGNFLYYFGIVDHARQVFYFFNIDFRRVKHFSLHRSYF